MRRHPEMNPENGGEKSGKCSFFSSLEFRHNSISCLVFLFFSSNKKQWVAPLTSISPPFPSFFISSNEASTLSPSFKCSPSSLQLKSLLSSFDNPIKNDLVDLALSTHSFCGSKELFLRRNVAPFAVEKEWYCGDFCAAKRNGSSSLKKEEREKWKEKEYFLKKTKRAVNEKRQSCK